jgi:hypothetical protein
LKSVAGSSDSALALRRVVKPDHIKPISAIKPNSFSKKWRRGLEKVVTRLNINELPLAVSLIISIKQTA